MPGTITFRPLEANLTHNTDLLTKMNPYCSFNLGGTKFNSQICKKGGKHPHWSDTVSLPYANESIVTLDLMDKDRLTKDDVIGTCNINLADFQANGPTQQWFPLFYKNKPAGEILLEACFDGQVGLTYAEAAIGSLQTSEYTGGQNLLCEKEVFAGNTAIVEEKAVIIEQPRKIFTEQHQTVEPHTFTKNVDVVETVSVLREIEVTEPRKVLKEVEYTEAVPVMKQIEVVEPQVVMKEVEVIEPRVVTKTIQVVENVPVKKQVEVVEMRHMTREVETMEPQTFTKTVEVIEQVPVKKCVQVSEPVTVTRAVEFVEPVITTQTITKEIRPEVIVDEKIRTEVGPATLVGVCESEVMRSQQQVWNQASGFRMEENAFRTTEIGETQILKQEPVITEVTKTTVFTQEPVIQEQAIYKEQRREGFFLDK